MPSLDSENVKLATEVDQASRVAPLPFQGEPSDKEASQENVSNGDADKSVPDPLQYQVETVDFPDSPQPTKKKKQKEHPLQVNSDDDSEDLVSIAADLSANGSNLNSWISSTMDNTDEYFEDSLMHTSSSCRDADILNWSTDNDHSLSFSNGSLSPTHKPMANDPISVKSNEMPSIQSNPDQPPDTELLQKLKDCFDQEKIKDIYVLSGRLQDILTPVEIQEIIINSDLYGDFIDDDMFEVLSAAYVELSSGFQRGGSIRDSRRKIRASLSHTTDLMDDIKVRAIFECHKGAGRDSFRLKKNAKSPFPPSGGDMRQFFEDNLVKGANTLQNVAPLDQKVPASPEKPTEVPINESPSQVEVSLYQDESFNNYETPEPLSMLVTSSESESVQDSVELGNEVDVKLVDVPLDSPPKDNKFIPARPGTLLQDGTMKKKKIKVSPGILDSDEHIKDEDVKSLSSLSNKSDADMMSPMEDLATPDDIETPDDMDESTLNGLGSYSEMIPELSAVEELEEERSWKTCLVGGSEQKIDMKVIEPYKKVLSHGGYFGPSRHAIIVFSACNLPDKSRRDYDYVMDNLFFYVLSTLDQLVAEDYLLVYLHGATQRSNMPTFGWLKRCYQMIDRRLRKNLKGLYLVHPTFWLKTIVIMTKPFVSTKFSRKLQFVSTLKELSELIPMDQVCIPDKVKQYEESLIFSPDV